MSERGGPLPEQARRAGSSRRSVLKASGLGLGAALGGAGAGAGGTRYRDTSHDRAHADGSTFAQGSTATSLRALWRADTSERVMALTFDDGPGVALTGPLLDVLRDEGVPATFAVVGRRAQALPDLVRRQAAEGHELVNHSWTHADLSRLGPEQVASELERTDELLDRLTGRRPALARPPYGRINGALMQHAAISGQSLLLWDLRFHDADWDSATNARFVLDTARPGSVVLGHDAGRRDRWVGCRAVPQVVREAKARGWRFVTGSEMLALDGAGGQARV